MKWFWLYILLMASIAIRCSDHTQEGSSSSDIDNMCDLALNQFYPAPLRSESFRIRPYLREVISQEPGLFPTTRETEPVAPSITQDHPHNHSFLDLPAPSPVTPLSDLIVRAYHKALLEKEENLIKKERELVLWEYRLQKKMSKKATIGIATVTGFLTSVMTLVITIISK